MPTEQEKFFGFMNDATAPVQWAVRTIKSWLQLIGIVLMLIIGVFGCFLWWTAGGYNADQEEANKAIASASRPYTVDFSIYYGSPKDNPKPDPTYCCDMTLRASIENTGLCAQPDLMGIRDERTKFLNWTSVGQGWSSEENGNLAMYRTYKRAAWNMEALCHYLTQAVPRPDLSAAPVVLMFFTRASGTKRDGSIVGMCVPHGPRYDYCNPEDRVPAVGRFRTLTKGQQEAIDALESTLTVDFWLKVAHANGFNDDYQTKFVAAKDIRATNKDLPRR
jgi:hypothetical protein